MLGPKKEKKKPYRLCILCDPPTSHSALSRHIRRKHKTETRVNAALKMKRKERIKAFENFKNEGILNQNLKESGKKHPNFVKNRKSANCTEDVPIMCNTCKKFISKKSFKRHSRSCCTSEKSFPVEIQFLQPGNVLKISDAFKRDILCSMYTDTIGLICKRDQAILLFGLRLYDKIKKRDDNKVGSRKDIRAKMRTLGHLLKVFNEKEPTTIFGNVKDLFLMDNFDQLKEAIEEYTYDIQKDKVKAGLKINLQHLLIKAAKVFEATAYVEKKEEESRIFEKFQTVINVWQVFT